MIVVDAAAIIDVILARPAAGGLLVRLFGNDEEVVAPRLIDSEVVHSLRKLWLNGLLSEQQAQQALTLFDRLAIVRIPNGEIVHRIWELRHNNSAYDATYVAVAEKLNAPLITRDARLARSSGHTARIEYID